LKPEPLIHVPALDTEFCPRGKSCRPHSTMACTTPLLDRFEFRKPPTAIELGPAAYS
jgi:hypothetical protein